MSTIKQPLRELCLQIIEQRIANCNLAIETANASINEDTKSSAGDKYETSREMMTQEIKNVSTQLAEALKQKTVLEWLTPDQTYNQVQLGSLVTTQYQTFFVSISVGELTYNGQKYVAVSAYSPIGKMLMNKKQHDSFLFNGKTYVIQETV